MEYFSLGVHQWFALLFTGGANSPENETVWSAAVPLARYITFEYVSGTTSTGVSTYSEQMSNRAISIPTFGWMGCLWYVTDDTTGWGIEEALREQLH